MVERHRGRLRRLSERRLYLPLEEPYLEGHNTWCVNVPGSLLVIPVADIAQHMVAILCFFVQNGYAVYDDVNDRKIPGLEEFAGLVDVEEPFPLTFGEQYALTEATAELATACYAGVLMLQAMGLGGWMFDGIDRFSMLGASGDPEVPGLGFRYDEDQRWSLPNPTGREGVFEAYCPPHHADMAAAVEAFAERKFGTGGPFNRDTPGRLERQSRLPRQRPGPRRRVQGVRRAPGAIRPRHLRQVPRHGADRVHHELRPGASSRPRLLRPLLQGRGVPTHARRAHGALARPGGELGMGEHVRAGDLDIWAEQAGEGPDVLLIAGLGDPAEAWQEQLDGLADRYRRPSTTVARDGRPCPRVPPRRSSWPTMRPRC